MEANKSAESSKIISAKNARMTASLFNLGNIACMLPGLVVAPFIILAEPERMTMIFMFILMVVPPILWFGLSIMVYIIARHHPNTRVGHFTQQAAYRYYGMIGLVIPVGTFYGNNWQLWIITGGIVGLVLVPWSLWDLFKIQKLEWQDTEITIEQIEGEQA